MRKKLTIKLTVMRNVRLACNTKNAGREDGKRMRKIITRKNLIHPMDCMGVFAETQTAMRARIKKITT